MAERAPSTRPWLVAALAVSLVGGWCALVPLAGAARAAEQPVRWQVVETANFRILNYGRRPVSRQVAEACENAREKLSRQWLPGSEQDAWSPKCELVLQPTDNAYLGEVGRGGRNTVASALVDRRDGRIVLRRIDVRATRADWQTAALAHELAHVVLADRFREATLPRWLDEGMAILADPHEKREQHRQSLKRAMTRGTHFRLAELLTLGDYPPAGRWGAFYGQSASVVEYLVEQQGHARFVEFVDLALDRGYDHALREVYGVGIAQLERRWHRHFTSPADEASADSRPKRRGAASEPASAG